MSNSFGTSESKANFYIFCNFSRWQTFQGKYAKYWSSEALLLSKQRCICIKGANKEPAQLNLYKLQKNSKLTPKVTNLLRSSLRQICPSEVIYSSRQSSTSHSRIKAESPHAHQTCVSMEKLRILGARESQRRILYENFI